MKTFFLPLCVFAALLLMARFSPVNAQYNPPPPPEQQNTGESDQGAPPPDQSAPPMQDDQNAPPPDQGPGDQGAPPPDQGAPDQGPGDQGAPPDQADNGSGDANFQTFYDNLGSQGNWVQTDNYGYVWQPNVQDPDWAPYTNGHWVYTEEGWTWVADESEPWGWATYHYGRWVNIDGQGWAWVPGYTWAPAWVSWRYGGGYCGWAPLPPDTFVGIDFGGVGFGFHIGGDCDTAYGIGPGYYNFVRADYLGDRNYRGHYENRNNNFALINNTRNVTNIVVNNQRGAGRFGRVNAGGPSLAAVNAQAKTHVQTVNLTRANRAGNSRVSGNSLAVFAPHVRSAANGTTFRPRSVTGNIAQARINNGTNINQPLQVNSRVRGAAPSAAQIAAAQTASTHFSSGAHIATANTQPTQALTRPLSAFQPHNEARTTHTAAGANPAFQPNHTVNNPSANGLRPENTFTGQAPATHNTNAQNRTFTPNSTQVHNNSNVNGANHTFNNQTAVNPHNAANGQNASNAQVHPNTVQQNTQVQHRDFTPQVQNNNVHPQTEVQHPQVQVQHNDFHPQVEHREPAPVQHNDFHPQQQQQRPSAPAPQAQHASAPPPHPSGGGGNNNHPSGGNGGKDNGKNDNKGK